MTTEEKSQKDLAKRSKAFNEELIKLLAKYKLGLGASAFLMPDGRIASRPQLFDDVKKVEEKDKSSELLKD